MFAGITHITCSAWSFGRASALFGGPGSRLFAANTHWRRLPKQTRYLTEFPNQGFLLNYCDLYQNRN